MENFDLTLFDLSPIAMWLQDFSGVKEIFQQWEADGIEDLEQFLLEDHSRLHQCLMTIKTLRVNSSALRLYEARDLDHVLENFSKFITPEITTSQIKFFCALWDGNTKYSIPLVNMTCNDKAIDIQLSANIVTGYEESWALLLSTTEHISDYQNARRFAEALLMYSPTALWVKDYSCIKKRFDFLKANGVERLESYVQNNPKFVDDCFRLIRSSQVNQALLTLFGVKNKTQFDQQSFAIFNQNKCENFYYQLLELWNGKKNIQQEGQYQTIDGKKLFLLEQFTIFPDSHDSWDTVQIAYTDFTERKKLEEHLYYMSQYDQLTQLYNRTFFNQEIERLHTQKIFPISCIYIDINGLKAINDSQGHYYGDLHLQRFAMILKRVTEQLNYSVSRVGGDEFVILMPNAGELVAQQLLKEIELETKEDQSSINKISFSSGIATMEKYQSIESLIKKADQNMYDTKKSYYRMRTI